MISTETMSRQETLDLQAFVQVGQLIFVEPT